jgi:hypothetical protein
MASRIISAATSCHLHVYPRSSLHAFLAMLSTWRAEYCVNACRYSGQCDLEQYLVLECETLCLLFTDVLLGSAYPIGILVIVQELPSYSVISLPDTDTLTNAIRRRNSPDNPRRLMQRYNLVLETSC